MIDVFVSAGRPVKPEQEPFLKALEDFLRQHDLRPRNLGRSDFSSRRPLEAVSSLMKECSGTVVVAYERIYIERGKDLGAEEGKGQLDGVALSTVWNQLEATMAYVLDQPLLVLVDKRVKTEGTLSKGHDWYVQQVDIAPESLRTEQFLGVFADWHARVQQRYKDGEKRRIATPSTIDVDRLTVNQLFQQLTVKQLWGVVAALILVLSTVAYASYQIGLAAAPP